MQNLDGKTKDIVSENIIKIKEIFPEVFTEDKVDFDMLQELLGKQVEIDNDKERYSFNWNGKRDAIRLATQLRSSGTLRPIKEESIDWDTTQNLFIEGDNLEVLRLLQSSYSGKIKMIYIDPPYNTGKDFVYPDNFTDNISNYLDQIKANMQPNPETSGRYHTKWLNMMYPRLKLARNLLKDDGAIFISIDDNEVHNLRKICDEIFGEDNFIAQLIWRGGKRNAARYISTSHEYILFYVKNLNFVSKSDIDWKVRKEGIDDVYKKYNELRKEYGSNNLLITSKLKEWYKSLPENNDAKTNSQYFNVDDVGIYFASDISRLNGGEYDVVNPLTGNVVQRPLRGWCFAKKEDMDKAIKDGRVQFSDKDGVPTLKRYLIENEYQLMETVFYKDRRSASISLNNLLGGNFFDFPKDYNIIKYYINAVAGNEKDIIVLDFFAGSSTTAHAVMQLNVEDGGNRKFIMVQLPESTPEDSEARKAGYNTISQISMERIRRAGKKIIEENHEKLKERENLLDIGFKAFSLDATNFKKWDPASGDISNALFDHANPFKNERSDEDALYEIMLKYGLDLTEPIEEKIIEGKKVYFMFGGGLVVCFDKDITLELAEEIGKYKPNRVVFLDASFNGNDALKENIVQILRQNNSDIEVKSI